VFINTSLFLIDSIIRVNVLKGYISVSSSVCVAIELRGSM
jgi:hypothetical protein